MKFIRNLLATITGLFIFSIIAFFIISGSLFYTTLGKAPVKNIKPNSVLKLDLSKFSEDYGGTYSLDDFDLTENYKNGLIDLLFAIEYAKTDPNIKGISIENNSTSLGISQRKELRKKLETFKKSGKFVLSYADNYSQGDYYLNSIADTIYLNPMGQVDFKGLATEILYMKDLQEKTGIKMEIIRHGKYKSAVEPFLQQNMSEANYEQTYELLKSIWETVVADISESRNITVEKLNDVATNLLGRNATLAKENRLVDRIAYVDEYKNALKHAVEIHKNKPLREVEIADYIKNVYGKNKTQAKDAIAVIFAQGEIKSGEGAVNYIGEKSINRALKAARENDNIKAIVLRVNSPGGSALTSEIIWREIELTRKDKPVIVSMGNTAASGGYYIASNADYIFADPTTITGSIGVFGMLPNAKELANEWGVTAHQVKTHENASNYSIFTGLNDKTRETITESIEHIYQVFLQRVATGRKMTVEQVNEIAQGRVWTGTMAKNIGLVDELGSLEDAIKYAAKITDTKTHRTILYPEYNISLTDYLGGFFNIKSLKENAIKEEIGEENYKLIQRVNYLKQSEDVQAIMPVLYNIH